MNTILRTYDCSPRQFLAQHLVLVRFLKKHRVSNSWEIDSVFRLEADEYVVCRYRSYNSRSLWLLSADGEWILRSAHRVMVRTDTVFPSIAAAKEAWSWCSLAS